MLPLFFRQTARRERVSIYGCEKIPAFTWIDDCIDGLTRGIDYLLEEKSGGEIISPGSGFGHTLIDRAGMIGRAPDTEPFLDFHPS